MKLIYNGVMASGQSKYGDWKQNVRKGEIYEVPDKVAKQLLKSNQWKNVEKKVKEVKKKNEYVIND